MELSERYIQTLEKEGYSNIEERQDAPNEFHSERSSELKATVLITDGSLTFDFGGEKKEVFATKRFNIPANVNHSVTAGPDGAIYMFGEKEEDDY